MIEHNKASVLRLIEEAWNQENYAIVDELVASDYAGQSQGAEGYKQYFGALRRAFPDIQFTVEDQIAEGDKVMSRWTMRATHTGAYAGIPPTGKEGATTGISVYRIADGKVVEGWTNVDELGMLRQIGAFPTPGQTA